MAEERYGRNASDWISTTEFFDWVKWPWKRYSPNCVRGTRGIGNTTRCVNGKGGLEYGYEWDLSDGCPNMFVLMATGPLMWVRTHSTHVVIDSTK